MAEIIKMKTTFCTGCNRCVRECPMEMGNITYQDKNGNVKVKMDHEKCITCGLCISACKHGARHFEDDTAHFFHDLENGTPITVIAAPAIRANIPEYKRVFTYLKHIGVKMIYDVSLGADICIWAHIRYIQEKEKLNEPIHMITQPCPTIVRYCEIYQHDLLKSLSPVHSPMSSLLVYMREYEGVTGKIAAISPCLAKAHEFEETGLADYNVTFDRLMNFIEINNIKLPDEETNFDYSSYGLGALFPKPGGLKENIEFFMGKKLSIDKAEGHDVYEKLNLYAKSSKRKLPAIFDVLNCTDGCNMGPGCSHSVNFFEINRTMDKSRDDVLVNQSKEDFDAVYADFDKRLDLTKFLREYYPIITHFKHITDEDMEDAFEQLNKTTLEKQNVDCGACGSETCYSMARKIALGLNIPVNCVVKSQEDANNEHIANMTAQKQMVGMAKLREADERIQVMLAANPQINIIFNSKFELIDCNPAALSFIGYETKEEMKAGFFERLEKSIPEFQSDGRASIPLAERFKAALTDGFVKFETDIILEGNPRTISVDFRKIPFEDSFAIVAFVFDMTDIHNREMELAKTRELNEIQLIKIKTAVKATKIGLWEIEIVDGDPINPNNAFMWSDEYRHMLGYTDEKDFPNLFKSWIDRVHPDDKDRILEGFAAYLSDPEKTNFDHEYWLARKDGEYSYFHGSGEIIRDDDGKAILVAGTIMDITEAKNILMDTERQKIEAEAANKAKSAFLSTMSHEIRTPMNAILGIADIQLQDEDLPVKYRDALEKIYTSGDMLLSIINDILDLSKIEAGKLELIPNRYETASLISDTAQLNVMRIGSKPIEFDLFVDEKLPVNLIGDELRVKQILNNLLSNAFKYTDAGTVKLSVVLGEKIAEKEITLIFSVSDTGQGMSKDQVNKLFDEYSRFNMEANRTTEGTGLGMSITRNLIQMMNGNIIIESDPGKGSIFSVHLPQGIIDDAVLGSEIVENLHHFRESDRSQMKHAQINREYMPYGSVLVVDDVETNIFVAKGLMTPYGLKIESAESGFSAIEKIKSGNKYDIVFMDHMMPKMDGIEATKKIRELGYNGKIVALTANAVAGQAEIFLKNGFDDFISKPIDIRSLNNMLNKLIRDNKPPEVIEEARRKAEEKILNLNEQHYKLALDANFAEVFINDAKRSLDVLTKIIKKGGPKDEEEIRAYIIHTHGMKSALANIGNNDLSAIALKLESAGRDNMQNIIDAETLPFITKLRSYIKEITPKDDKTVKEDDVSYLNGKLKAIKDACEEYECDIADAAIAELKEKSWTKATKELINDIAELLLHSEFEQVTEKINKYLN